MPLILLLFESCFLLLKFVDELVVDCCCCCCNSGKLFDDDEELIDFFDLGEANEALLKLLMLFPLLNEVDVVIDDVDDMAWFAKLELDVLDENLAAEWFCPLWSAILLLFLFCDDSEKRNKETQVKIISPLFQISRIIDWKAISIYTYIRKIINKIFKQKNDRKNLRKCSHWERKSVFERSMDLN